MITTTEAVPAKYIFIDIVNYSYKRTIESATTILSAMNSSVREALNFFEISIEKKILLPTGDGICIALLDINNPFDIHIKVALEILRRISEYNKMCEDETRKFNIRVGINENVDNTFVDINGNKNIAGVGINEAQRIMDQGSAGNIMVGRAVYDRLKQREYYNGKFICYNIFIKHNLPLEVHQYIDNSIPYINSSQPTSISIQNNKITNTQIPNNLKDLKFSNLIAYFLGHLLKNRDFILKYAGSARENFALFALISYFAKDSIEKSEAGKFEEYFPILPPGNIEEQFEYLRGHYFELLMDYSVLFFESAIYPYSGGSIDSPLRYFQEGSFCLDITNEAYEKLKTEHIEILKELGLK